MPRLPFSHLEELEGGTVYESKARPAQKSAVARLNLVLLSFFDDDGDDDDDDDDDDDTVVLLGLSISSVVDLSRELDVENVDDTVQAEAAAASWAGSILLFLRW
jgi:hypothetical protein